MLLVAVEGSVGRSKDFKRSWYEAPAGLVEAHNPIFEMVHLQGRFADVKPHPEAQLPKTRNSYEPQGQDQSS